MAHWLLDELHRHRSSAIVVASSAAVLAFIAIGVRMNTDGAVIARTDGEATVTDSPYIGTTSTTEPRSTTTTWELPAPAPTFGADLADRSRRTTSPSRSPTTAPETTAPPTTATSTTETSGSSGPTTTGDPDGQTTSSVDSPNTSETTGASTTQHPDSTTTSHGSTTTGGSSETTVTTGADATSPPTKAQAPAGQ